MNRRGRRRRGGRALDYDAELRLHNEVLRRACDVQRHDQILDIGCGTGRTTRDAARIAAAGSAVGIDLSADVIDRARDLVRAEGLHNVTFEHGDAQVHPFPPAHFDLAISRFGTMFFHDPVAAFVNIGRALRPAGRLVMMVWQGYEQNAWSVAIERALGGPESAPRLASEESDPFSLADPALVERILDAAGFADVTLTGVDRPVYYGRDVAAALEWVRGFTCTRDVLARSDAASAERAIGCLRRTFAAHARGGRHLVRLPVVDR